MKTFRVRSGIYVLCGLLCLVVPGVARAQVWSAVMLADAEPEISMDFKDASLKDVLKAFSVQSGLNFIAAADLKERRVTLYLDKVPLDKAMEKLFAANNLEYEFDREANIFMVRDRGVPTLNLITRVFHLKYATVSTSSLKEEVERVLASGDQETVGASSSSGGGGSGEGGKWEKEDSAGITTAIKGILSKNDIGESVGFVIEDYRTNSLIVTDTPAQMVVIAQLIAALDVPTEQVMLEVEMLDVSKNAVDRLGVNWPSTLISLTVPGTRSTRFPFGSSGTNYNGNIGTGVDATDIQLTGSNSYGGGLDFGSWQGNHFAPSILTVIGATLTLDFLRSQTDTKFLARPKLLTLSNEPAEIRIATNEAIGVKTATTDTTSNAEPERSETGVILRVTPQVNSETGEITMFLYPKVAEAVSGSTFTAAGESYQYRDPEERSTKSVVRVKDGNTVVIGGLIRNEVTAQETKLPFFGDLPLVGWFFKHKGGTSSSPDKDRQRELLVFITPHIVRDTDPSVRKQADVQPSVPDREQSIARQGNRQTLIDSSLNKFDRSKSN